MSSDLSGAKPLVSEPLAPESPAPEPLTGAALIIVGAAVGIGTFMPILDGTVTNVALTAIAGNLGESVSKAVWVITAFVVANSVTMPLTGWLMKRYGLVQVFIASVTLFTFASLLCGVAWNMPSLVVFRIIQGAVAGPLVPGSQALMLAVFPPAKRPMALAIWAVSAMVAPIAGPVLGGYIADHFHWGWIFLINVPVGLAVALILPAYLGNFKTPTFKLPIDVIGLALLVIWVGAMQLVLDLGKDADWFASPPIIALGLISAIAIVVWLIWELTDKAPMVDLSLFRSRNFALGTLALSLCYGLFFANTLLLPLWLQQHQNYTATLAGLVALPAGLVAILVAPAGARFAPNVDARWLATIAFAAFGIAYWMRSDFTTQVDMWHIALPAFVQGIAIGLFFTSLITISLDGIPPERMPSATGLANFARGIAGAFGASIASAVWERRETIHQSRLVETAVPTNPAFAGAVQHMEGAGLSAAQAAAMFSRQTVNQAFLLSSTDLFWFSSIASVALIAIIWMTKRPAVSGGMVVGE